MSEPGHENGTSAAWDRALSKAAELRPVDMAATGAALGAVRAERRRREARRPVLGRWAAGLAAAAVVAGALVLQRPPAAPTAANEAYDAYREASRGW